MKIFSLIKKILSFFYRLPDKIIYTFDGLPYLLRWFVIPRNRWFNIYLHKVISNDDERALHDHPWYNFSLLLSGQYIEVRENSRRKFKSGSVILRDAKYSHRLELIDNKPCWTLFITGPRLRTWGFHCPKGWVDYETFDKNNGCN